jgi:dipeptidyl-peptidase-4
MDPYGGLALRKVLNAQTPELLVSQWFANQGFAVIVADGRGTPGRGPAWERAVYGDIETSPLRDQIDALTGVADSCSGLLDLNRVAIRGWSWGGFLAAMAVLRRPDVFHAGIAGAAVLDQRLYHSYWKERQLGSPIEYPARYDRHTLTAYAQELRRPLLLIHGLADDNVLPAHTLRLSAALMAANRQHEVLLLAGQAHDALRQPVSSYVFEHQLDFLVRALQPGNAELGQSSLQILEEPR